MPRSFSDPRRDVAIVGRLLVPPAIQKRVFSRKNLREEHGSPFFSAVSLLDFHRNALHLGDRRDCKAVSRPMNFSISPRGG